MLSALPNIPVSILHKSIAGRYRPVRVADGPITARYRFIKNASWDLASDQILHTLARPVCLNTYTKYGNEKTPL